MLNINDTAAKIFVKGFSQEVNYDALMDPCDCHGEFIAIITDLVTSGYVKVTSATKDEDGKWVLECSDGKIRTLEQEPATPREMRRGRLVTNFVCGFMEERYDMVFPDEYEEAIKDIANGESYRLIGYINGNKVVTSRLVKFWTDSSGRSHGVTKSGSHYIF